MYFLKILLAIGALCVPRVFFAQDAPRSYFFDEEDIVFVFDIRDYEKAVNEKTQKELDFSDLDIYKVAVTGEFSDWSREGWAMEKVGEFTYQLRKPRTEFHDQFPLEFKYIINEQYWAQPGVTFPNVRKFNNDFFQENYNLTLYDVVPNFEGNAFFFLDGFDDATSVILTGTFVGWDEDYLKMNRVEGGWQMRLDLLPDRYEYKFIVDGEWIHDPQNPNRVRNQHGTWNSVLQVAKTVRFELDGYFEATRVALTGTFNDWSHAPMMRGDGYWFIDVAMPGGKYHYKFVIDGRYMLDPDNDLVEINKEGMEFSVKIVQ